MTELKLIALDEEDLKVISAHLQDAVTTVGDLAYLPAEKRFAVLLNRFDWIAAEQAAQGRGQYQRRRAALRFEQVTAARVRNISLDDKAQVLNLLAVQFDKVAEGDPGGQISLIFAGDAAIQFDVQFIEAELKDLGAVWSTASKPEHADEA
jgi:hypothetical protein